MIGRTGSGKTTLAQLILRFYDPTNGCNPDGWAEHSVTFDLHDFRKQIGYVPQDVFLFSETVTGNIFLAWTGNWLQMQRKPPNLPALIRKSAILVRL